MITNDRHIKIGVQDHKYRGVFRYSLSCEYIQDRLFVDASAEHISNTFRINDCYFSYCFPTTSYIVEDILS